jgi:hypothetical protein
MSTLMTIAAAQMESLDGKTELCPERRQEAKSRDLRGKVRGNLK